MSKGRLEAFSDGVFAIIITIMVLDLKVPNQTSLAALRPVLPVFLGYIVSFIYVGIYWNNHHHMFQASQRVSGGILWANLHLLFWLSLVPFATGWVGENFNASGPVALYGVILMGAGCAYYILEQLLIRRHGRESRLALSVGRDRKGIISVVAYATAIPVSFRRPSIACAIYLLVAILWLIPDRRIERNLHDAAPQD
jgi:uncharacterized membrane protein